MSGLRDRISLTRGELIALLVLLSVFVAIILIVAWDYRQKVSAEAVAPVVSVEAVHEVADTVTNRKKGVSRNKSRHDSLGNKNGNKSPEKRIYRQRNPLSSPVPHAD